MTDSIYETPFVESLIRDYYRELMPLFSIKEVDPVTLRAALYREVWYGQSVLHPDNSFSITVNAALFTYASKAVFGKLFVRDCLIHEMVHFEQYLRFGDSVINDNHDALFAHRCNELTPRLGLRGGVLSTETRANIGMGHDCAGWPHNLRGKLYLDELGKTWARFKKAFNL